MLVTKNSLTYMKKDVMLISFFILFILVGLFIRTQNKAQEPDADAAAAVTLSEITAKIEPSDAAKTITEGGEDTMRFNQPPEMLIDPAKTYAATLITNKGNITIDLDASDAPKTVNNFVFLARQGFYDGVIFHRVIKDFMIQAGDPLGTGTGGPGYMFEDEIVDGKTFDGPGILAMANSGPNTNGSQFFITHAETPWLNGRHTIFGNVTDGMDIVDAIALVETSAGDRPVDDVIIETIEIQEN